MLRSPTWQRPEARRRFMLVFALGLMLVTCGATFAYRTSCGIIVDFPKLSDNQVLEVWVFQGEPSIFKHPLAVLREPGRHELFVPPGQYYVCVDRHYAHYCNCKIFTPSEVQVARWQKAAVNALQVLNDAEKPSRKGGKP